jgi:hypothetical protein
MTQALGVPPGKAQGAVTLMCAAKLVTARRIAAGCGPVAHFGQL